MILITGATGTNGRPLVELLKQQGAPLRLMVRDKAKAEKLGGPSVELIEGDLDAPDTLEEALKGIETAFLLPPFVPDAVEMQRNFIEAAKSAGVKRIVKFSVLGADSNGSIAITKWHGEAEELLKNSGLQWTILRPNAFMQNLLGLADPIKGGTLYEPVADARISMVDVNDIAAVAAATLTQDGHEGQIYEITGPQGVDSNEVAAALSAATGTTVTYVAVSSEQFRASLAGAPQWLIDALDELYAAYRTGAFATVTNDVERVTGRSATDIDTWAKENAEAFKS